MKSFRIDDSFALSDERIAEAIRKASKRKRTRRDVQRVLDNLELSIEELQRMINTNRFNPRKHKPVIINEHGPHKAREIVKPDYWPEQVTHHVVVQALKDPIMHGMSDFVMGSIPGRGGHLGKKYIEKWLREDPEHTRIIGKFDIKHFFQSIDHDVLRAWLRKKIRPSVTLDLCDVIIDALDMGLALGFYTSQWFGNFLLQPLDHMVQSLPGVYHYMRYMDDGAIFGSNKKMIHKAMQEIDLYLWREFGLTMKKDWTVFRFEYTKVEAAVTCGSLCDLYRLNADLKIRHRLVNYHGRKVIFLKERDAKRLDLSAYHAHIQYVKTIHGRPLDYMGFEFHRDRTVMRESIMLTASRKAAAIGGCVKINWIQASAMLSYMGWITHTDTYGFYENYIKPLVNVRALKRIVSKHQRRLNNEADLHYQNRIPGYAALCA